MVSETVHVSYVFFYIFSKSKKCDVLGFSFVAYIFSNTDKHFSYMITCFLMFIPSQVCYNCGRY